MSTIIEIPGGQATLADPASLTKRQKRALESVFLRLAPVAPKFAAYTQVDPAADTTAELPELSKDEVGLTYELQDVAIITFLESWTLDRPLPTLDTVGDLPEPLYDALEAATTPLVLTPGPDFSPHPDPTVGGPTGA